jgi:hypothetical protein
VCIVSLMQNHNPDTPRFLVYRPNEKGYVFVIPNWRIFVSKETRLKSIELYVGTALVRSFIICGIQTDLVCGDLNHTGEINRLCKTFAKN